MPSWAEDSEILLISPDWTIAQQAAKLALERAERSGYHAVFAKIEHL